MIIMMVLLINLAKQLSMMMILINYLYPNKATVINCITITQLQLTNRNSSYLHKINPLFLLFLQKGQSRKQFQSNLEIAGLSSLLLKIKEAQFLTRYKIECKVGNKTQKGISLRVNKAESLSLILVNKQLIGKQK